MDPNTEETKISIENNAVGERGGRERIGKI
jgi:hypothetical protein